MLPSQDNEKGAFLILQKRRNDFQQTAGHFVEKVFAFYALGCNKSRLCNTGIKIKNDIPNAWCMHLKIYQDSNHE